MAMVGKHVFGGVMIPRFKYVRERHGEDGFEALIEAMNDEGYHGPEDERIFKSVKRYPFNYLYIFLKAYLELYGEREFTIMNKAIAHKKGIVGFLIKWKGTPEKVIGKAGYYWSKFYDFGEMKGKMRSENEGVLIGDGVSPKPLFCRVLTDYFKGITESVDAEDIEIEHTACVHKGDEMCTWEISWKNRRDGSKPKI